MCAVLQAHVLWSRFVTPRSGACHLRNGCQTGDRQLHPRFWGTVLTLNKVISYLNEEASSLSQNLVAPICPITTICHPFLSILSIPKDSDTNLDRSSHVRGLPAHPYHGIYTFKIQLPSIYGIIYMCSHRVSFFSVVQPLQQTRFKKKSRLLNLHVCTLQCRSPQQCIVALAHFQINNELCPLWLPLVYL